MAAEPLARGIILHSFREAAAQLWGADSAAAIASLLPEEARATAIGETASILEWQPERFVVAWHEAVWSGPAHRDLRLFHDFLHCSVDLSFGRVRRALLAFLTPDVLVRKAVDLWRHDHTHGVLELSPDDATSRGAVVTLRDHPYVSAPASRQAITEILRYIATLAHVTNVRAVPAAGAPFTLTVRILWD